MIKIQRSRSPKVLIDNSANWTQELCMKRKQYFMDYASYQSGRTNKRPDKVNAVSGRYAHAEVMQELSDIFNGKCAYCECQISHITYKAVDHFRPQSIFPSLAYDWDNLILSCPKCNSDFKKAKFPLVSGEMAQADIVNPCSLNNNVLTTLIDPTITDPDDHFDFSRDIPISKTYEGASTISILRLDRDELKDIRRDHIIKLQATILIYKRANDEGRPDIASQADQVLREYVKPKSQFLAYTRAIMAINGLSTTHPC